jgi:class 3 adenylate cyclase
VSVLFADLVGFTVLPQDMSASRLVKMLDGLFGQFDALVEQHGLCKIKTIGDCYRVAGGHLWEGLISCPDAEDWYQLNLRGVQIEDLEIAIAFRHDDGDLDIDLNVGPKVADYPN